MRCSTISQHQNNRAMRFHNVVYHQHVTNVVYHQHVTTLYTTNNIYVLPTSRSPQRLQESAKFHFFFKYI